MSQAYVIYEPEGKGIYLGSFMGLGFWSSLDAAGQDAACTFNTVEQAREFVSSWNSDSNPDDYEYTLVSHTEGWASVEQCEVAGLPGWDPDYSPLPDRSN